MNPIREDAYSEYDEYEDYLAGEAPRSRKPKPKKASRNLMAGIVVRSLGHHFDVRISAGESAGQVRLCEVRGRLLQGRGRDTLVAVGDRVWIAPHGEGRGKIERIEERTSVLSRQHPGVSVPAEDVILANPDQVLIIFSVAQPEPHLRMLDRFLVIAEANKIPALICANKIDLIGLAAAQVLFEMYAQIGYPVIYSSAETGEGIDELREYLTSAITVLSGPSGVGKSSLLNVLEPDAQAEIGELREVLDKGRHTTRTAQLYALPFGEETFIADTPGIRELGLYDIEPYELGFFFREFLPEIYQCRYPDCTHDHEPGCAVRQAVEEGRIFRRRYDSYIRLLHGEE